ncbi:DUF2505 family protein [Brevibacterium senegalense]|uniref:DUF2505 family protein n=1 Tax=Brevibacterium senegalense TaxID=1033736 RepID=UPI00037049CC|nr:DUF2505 family protein [Brevibacterium senegalense]
MRTFTLTGRSALPPTRLRAGLTDPDMWRGQGREVTRGDDGSLTVDTPLAADSVPPSLARYVPESAALRMRVAPAAEAPAGSPQRARLTVTVPGAPVAVTVDLSAAADGHGALVTAEAEVSSSVPLLGPMVESAVEPVVRAQLREKLDQLVDLV